MVARYAPPISYNFLNLIRLSDGAKTIFEQVICFLLSALVWLFFGEVIFKNVPLISHVFS